MTDKQEDSKQSKPKRTGEQRAFENIGRLSDKGAGNKGLIDRLFGRWINVPNHKDWVVDAEWARIQQQPIRSTQILYVILFALIALVIWASFAEVATVARGDGRVVPSQQLQTIETLDGGQVQSIAVREGDRVEAGDVLVEIDSTRFLSEFRENQARLWALQARSARLRALVTDNPLAFPESLTEDAPQLVADERAAYNSNLEQLDSLTRGARAQLAQRRENLNELQAAAEQYEQSLALVNRELTVTEPLQASGAVSEVDIIRLQRDRAQFRGQLQQTLAKIKEARAAIDESESKLSEVRLDQINQWRQQLAEVSADLAAFESVELRLQDRVAQSKLRAPVSGIIQTLHVNTIGGVVTPGQPVVDIVPVDDELIIEARILPRDIAFVKRGQTASIKFTAYDFSIYGGADAVVEHISADTVTDENDVTYYVVRLRSEQSEFAQQLDILPGMVTQVDIKTGERTVMSYLLKPVRKAYSEALTER